MNGFNFKCTSGPFGDCTSNYEIEFSREFTVREFVNEVIKDDREWGAFHIVTKAKPFGIEESKYRYGKILSSFSEETLDRKIKSVKANGGWSEMSYYITLKRKTKKKGENAYE